MPQPSDIQYFLDFEGDQIPLTENMTLGRHLDNDVLLSGEDVLDYHLRLETTSRGPRAIALGEASLRVNGQERADGWGIMPDDVLEVGQNVLTVAARPESGDGPGYWRLHGPGGVIQTLGELCRVGRSEGNELQIQDDHVSRHHAELAVKSGTVWLRDLGSSNGTYVNGERVRGACRLFHGDEIRFDALGWQLVGEGGDLTPVRKTDPAARQAPFAAPRRHSDGSPTDTTEIAAVEPPPTVQPRLPPDGETGAFILGASEPVSGLTFHTNIGRTLIGRDEDCDLVIRDRTVSGRHAELMVRAEGITITNLMATNGTRVNGEEVQTARLHDGDVLRFGRVNLVFKEVPVSEESRPWLRHAQMVLLVASLVLALGLVLYLL